MKLRKLVKESWLDEKKKLSKEEKKNLLEKIARFGEFGKAIYNEYNLVEIAKELSEIAGKAESLTLSEAGDEFDAITVGRNMKELKNLSAQFAKVATEQHALNQRTQGLYEDMGGILNRYYNIKEVQDSQKVDNGMGTKPYDGSKSSDNTNKVNEISPQQIVSKNHGLKPYDNQFSNEIGGLPNKIEIEESKKKNKK